MLEKELAYFEKNKEKWIAQFEGKFVLVKGEELAGVYDTNEEALSGAASMFGLSPCLIRRIVKIQEEIKLPALTLGLLYANPTHSTCRTSTNS